ncbi:predicted protein [Arabidopsis lyrata subsp. lyrata]|uniref:Predicted protein n=1 Tax=Arabidopsis lyrata subsp. lyrata TaxID=81972 RepID=D7MM60_ARALL|nr:predicted protein [Arabidopsis lyrata subsp. lyrata]
MELQKDMPLDITPISQITLGTDPCKINVRIVRLWGFPKKDKLEEFTGIDLLLMDEKAEINFVDVEKLDNNEDNAYNVSTPKPTTKRSLATSKDVQQSSTKPKLMSKAQIKKEK